MSVDECIDQAKVLRKVGDFPEAALLYEQAAAISEAAGDRTRSLHSLRHAAEIQLHAGNVERARQHIQAVLGHYRNDKPNNLEMANALRVGGLAAEAAGDFERGRQLWGEAREIYAELKIDAGVTEADRRIAAMAA